MSAHVTKLAAFFAKVASGRPVFCDEAVDVAGALDDLLAEHRVEVEEAGALRTALLKSSGWLEPIEAATLKAKAEGARDAALEEVAVEALRRAALCRRVYAGTPDAPKGEGAGDALETLAGSVRASKSRPAERYLPESKVREAIRDTRRESTDMRKADERDFLRRLGVEVHAAPDVSRGVADHPSTWGTAEDAQAIREGRPLVWSETAPEPITIAGRTYPASQVHNEPEPPPVPEGQCPGCDMPADGSKGHRLSCSAHGKNAPRLGATKTGEGFQVAASAPASERTCPYCHEAHPRTRSCWWKPKE